MSAKGDSDSAFFPFTPCQLKPLATSSVISFFNTPLVVSRTLFPPDLPIRETCNISDQE